MARSFKTRLDQAVEELRAYFGVLSQDDLFNVLAGSTTLEDQKKILTEMVSSGERPPPGMAPLINMIQSQETAFTTHEIIENINSFCAQADSETKKLVEKTFLVVQEDSESQLSNIKECGIKTSMNSLTKDGQNNDGKDINENPQEPSKDKPGLSAIVVKPNTLNPANRGTSGIEIFLNAIPTVEMSRCVPFLDVTLIPPTPAISDDGKIQTVSMLQFLKGNFKPAAGGTDEMIANAVSLEIKKNVLDVAPPTPTDEPNLKKDNSRSSAGMEMFTTPQSLVNGNEVYSQLAPQDRAAPVIDRFRPFMSIKDFKVDLVPSAGLLTFKTATLSVILHDRSRLSEISEFVKPDLYGKTEMLITYGWSHPDGLLPGNVYGRFLDSLKCTEKYGIVNSSFSFDEVGQVSINLKLSLKGSSQITLTKISEGEGVKEALSEVKKLTEAVKAHRKKISGGKKGSKKIDGSSVLSKLSDTGSAMSFDKETSKKLDEFLNAARTSQSKEIKAMIPNLIKLTTAIPKAQKNMARLVSKKVKAVSVNRNLGLNSDELADPFIKTIEGKTKKYVSISKENRNYVSFGALLLHFCGRPLAATGQFDEVQFIFYAFNSYASYVRSIPISSFPINMKIFLEEFKQASKTTTNMSVGQFISFICRKFVTTQMGEAYGLTDLYESDKEEPGKLKLKERFEDKTILKGEKDLRLEDAYGEGADLKFKVPKIQMQAECLPGSSEGKSIYRIHIFDQRCSSYTNLGQILKAAESENLVSFTSNVGKAAADDDNDDAGRKKEFLTQINQAISNGILEAIPSTTEVTEADITGGDIRFRVKSDFETVKNYLRSMMPSLIYGSSCTNIKGANLASMNNPALTNINMRRSGMGTGASALGLRESGLPLQIAPMKLSLQTLGCPIASIGQQFFVDFGTGTSADNIYCCSKVSHSIASGEFSTSMEFQPLNAYGQYTNLGSVVDQAIAEISSDGEK